MSTVAFTESQRDPSTSAPLRMTADVRGGLQHQTVIPTNGGGSLSESIQSPGGIGTSTWVWPAMRARECPLVVSASQASKAGSSVSLIGSSNETSASCVTEPI